MGKFTELTEELPEEGMTQVYQVPQLLSAKPQKGLGLLGRHSLQATAHEGLISVTDSSAAAFSIYDRCER